MWLEIVGLVGSATEIKGAGGELPGVRTRSFDRAKQALPDLGAEGQLPGISVFGLKDGTVLELIERIRV